MSACAIAPSAGEQSAFPLPGHSQPRTLSMVVFPIFISALAMPSSSPKKVKPKTASLLLYADMAARKGRAIQRVSEYEDSDGVECVECAKCQS